MDDGLKEDRVPTRTREYDIHSSGAMPMTAPRGIEASIAHEPSGAASLRPGSGLRRAILTARQWLLAAQHADGYWVGELEGDTILESEYILLLAYLGEHGSERAGKRPAISSSRSSPRVAGRSIRAGRSMWARA